VRELDQLLKARDIENKVLKDKICSIGTRKDNQPDATDMPDYSGFTAPELTQLLKARDLENKVLRKKTQSAAKAKEQHSVAGQAKEV
jgi:hypothetical protein